MEELQQQIATIKTSGFFDAKWYLAEYQDVSVLEMDPIEHYLLIGAQLMRNPGAKFDTQSYLVSNPDVDAAGMNPLLHYILFGKQEGRSTGAVQVPVQVPKDAGKGQAKIKGGINRTNPGETVIRGWLAELGSPAPRTAVLTIDGTYKIALQASTYRADLKKNQINEGKHAFELIVPSDYIDGKSHHLQLVDQATGNVIGQCDVVWQQSRRFKDFTGFLAESYVSPVINAPYREEDKRCFAAMENVAKSLVDAAERAGSSALVSIVMPVHNRLGTVKAAIDSVLSQVYQQFELIIVDDGSTDGTTELVKSYQDVRIKFFRFDQCGGVSAARNKALTMAKGKYIAYLDSDNTWDDRYVAAMVGAFNELPTAAALYSGQLLYRGDQSNPFAIRFGSFNRSLAANRNYIDLNAFCHTREIYESLGGFDLELRRYVDWDLILRIAEAGKVFSVPVLLSNYYYEKADNTITGNESFTHYLDIVREKRSRRVRDNAIKLRKPLERKVAVIIPSYEAAEDIEQCIASILESGPKNVEIIVVDNGSSEDVIGYLKDIERRGEIKLIANGVNFGFTHAVNLGIAAAHPSADIILLNNDALITPGAIEELQRAAYVLDNCGLVVPQQLLPGGTKTIVDHVPFANPNVDCDVNLSAHHANILNPPIFADGDVTEIGFAPFFCVYIKRDVLNRTGMLDAEYGRHYRSDRIFCDYVRHILKMRIYHIASAVVIHKLQKSTDKLRNDSNRNSEFDLMFRQNRWGTLGTQLGFREAPWDC